MIIVYNFVGLFYGDRLFLIQSDVYLVLVLMTVLTMLVMLGGAQRSCNKIMRKIATRQIILLYSASVFHLR